MTKRCKFLNYTSTTTSPPEIGCNGMITDCPKPKNKRIVDLGCYLPEETDDKSNAMSFFEA